MSLFHDWRNQVSWGRVCAFVALLVAVVQEFRAVPPSHILIWLGTAVGNYGLSKGTEMVCAPKGGQDGTA